MIVESGLKVLRVNGRRNRKKDWQGDASLADFSGLGIARLPECPDSRMVHTF